MNASDSSGVSAPIQLTSAGDDASQSAVSSTKKKNRQDFKFEKVLGKGSYSTVYLAREEASGKQYAIKVLQKRHIIKEKKVSYVSREKNVLAMINHPFFVRLYFTFQDVENLYYGLSYAEKGELLPYIQKLGSFDETCTRFYSAEIIVALEYLHSLNIIHRDLKPENILLDANMHIKVTDFGTVKVLGEYTTQDSASKEKHPSFVGTAQYVSPEMLVDKKATKSSDLWALGCVIYQMLAGLPPFRAMNEYHIFQKITKLDYSFPDGFPAISKDLVQKILVLDPTKRLGCEELGGYPTLKAHQFYDDIQWDVLDKQTPPKLLPYLPCKSGGDGLRSDYDLDIPLSQDDDLIEFQDNFLARFGLSETTRSSLNPVEAPPKASTDDMLARQKRENTWHQFVGNNLIVKTGTVEKRKGLFARRRQLILTEGPHLYYVDPSARVLKGEIPWTKDLRPELKNNKIFFVHTPSRTYYLEDCTENASLWVDEIEKVHRRYFG